ncbi:MAG: S8 family serine peptidase [Hyphomicrobiaceae bacterium]|nr:S8 family serine peptidase [Hyphomicrobiaceae bacterium]
MDAARARDLLRAQSGTAEVDLNHLYYLQGSVCTGPQCSWQLSLTDWITRPEGCRISVPIGMLDTAVSVREVDARDGRIAVARLAPRHLRPAPGDHGTAIASLLVGRRGATTPGLLSGPVLFVADVFFLDDRGQPATDAATLVAGLAWLKEKGVRVVNLSIAGPPNALLETAIRDHAAAGMMIIAAVGNNGPDAPPRYPAAYPQVVAVTAIDKWEQIYNRANQGPHIALAAPGVGLLLTSKDARPNVVSGTSYATPFVTAAVAAVYKETAASRAETLDRIQTKDLGEKGDDPVFGRGLLRAPAACAGSGQVDAATR